ncbi:MAG: tetratricopeptide repeat protein, partial [Alphaproteobacteria bacterium]|nr:tetratricopeptide repeat protein [Alphaproteobacteria bacterium]
MTRNGSAAGEIARIEALLAARGASADLLRRLGNLKEERGDIAGAIACYRRATDGAPHDAAAWCDLAIGLEQVGDLPGAEGACRRAIAADESFADAHANLGLLLQRSGRHPEAVAALDRAASLSPSAASFHNLGNAQRLAGDAAAALASYAEALRLDPSSAITATALAEVLAGRSQAGLADALLRRALAIAPSIGVALRRSLLLAQIEDSEASIAARRTAVAEGFASLKAAGATIRDPIAEVPGTAFYLAYHGENDRALQSQIARFYLDACPDLGWAAPDLGDRARRSRGSVRLALVSEKFRNHTVGKLTLDLVRALDRSQVEPLLFVVSPKDDPVQR